MLRLGILAEASEAVCLRAREPGQRVFPSFLNNTECLAPFSVLPYVCAPHEEMVYTCMEHRATLAYYPRYESQEIPTTASEQGDQCHQHPERPLRYLPASSVNWNPSQETGLTSWATTPSLAS